MKKTILLFLSFILLMSCFGPSIGKAMEKDALNPWSIESYRAFADVKSNGSMVIEEYITYKFTKGFTGTIERRIDTFAASEVEDLRVYDITEPDKEDISKSKLEQMKSDSYEVILDKEYGMLQGIDISVGTDDKERTLVFKYTLKDLVGVYKDMALLEWSFLDQGESYPLDSISININIPTGGNIEDVKSFLQGPLYSQQVDNDEDIAFEARIMDKDRDLKVIMLLPTSMIPEGRKKIDNEITGEVLSYREKYENEIDEIRKEYESRQLTIKLLTYITLGVLVLSVAYLYFKYHRDPRTTPKVTYLNKLPADYYTPAELGVFMNRGRVKPNYIVASLMDLVSRDYLKAETSEEGSFILSKNSDAEFGQLKDHEKYLLAWLFDDLGGATDGVSTKDFEKWVKNPDNKKKYSHKFKTWKSLVVKRASKWRVFEDVAKARTYGLLVGILGLVPGAVLYAMGENFKGMVIVSLSLATIIYSRFIRKRTEFGAVNYRQWKAFKNYLRKASQSNLPKPEVDAWERFLVYSIPIGCAEETVEQFRNIYDDSELRDSNLFLLHDENLDNTLYWVNSMKEKNSLRVRLSHVSHLSGTNPPTIDRKG